MLDRIATRYNTDPASVLEWSAFRLGLAMAAYAAGSDSAHRIAAEGAQPVIVLGGI